MTFPLFDHLPQQREGPITLDGQSLIACPACHGKGGTMVWGTRVNDFVHVWTQCRKCNGGGEALVRSSPDNSEGAQDE